MSYTWAAYGLESIADKKEGKLIVQEATKRSIVRSIHLVLAIPIIGYIYSPFEQIPNYAFPTRFVFVPALALPGLWRLISKRSA